MVSLAALPLIMLPITNNFISQSKLFFVFLIALITGALFFLQALKKQSWKIILSPASVPFLFFGISSAASTFFTNQYPVQALLGMGGIYLSTSIIVLLGGSLFSLSKKQANHLINTLAICAGILSISQLLQLIGFGPSRLINQLTGLNLPNNLLFNLAGSSFIALQFFLISLIGSIAQIIKSKAVSNLHIITIPLMLFGLGLAAWAILPGKESSITLPPFTANWSVMLDSIRAPRAALIGQGPEAYSTTYTRFKPQWVNGQNYWQINFGASSNHPMTLVVTMGFLGLAAWIVVATRFINKKTLSAIKTDPILTMIIASFVLQLLLPANVVMLSLQAILIAFWVSSHAKDFPTLKLEALSMTISTKKDFQLLETKPKNWLIRAINVAFLGGIAYLTLLTGKAYASFYRMHQANLALAENKAVAVYDNHRIARNLNVYSDSIRRSYAATNMQIAIALSNKADTTDEEKQQVSTLIQQAINEARNATALDINNTQNWLVLAQIYQNLIGSTEEADQWAVNSYVKAIETDPSNPFTRINLGVLFLDQQQLEQAISILQQAINIKPDIPTGYYQLSRALITLKRYVEAKQALEQTLSLLAADSEDYVAVNKQLEEIKPLAEEQAKAAAEAQAKQAQAAQQQGQTVPQGAIDQQGAGTNKTGIDQTGIDQFSQIAPSEEQMPETTSQLGAELDSLTEQNLQDPSSNLGENNQEELELSEDVEFE